MKSTYIGPDSETAKVLNTKIHKNDKNTIALDQIKSGQSVHKIKTDSKLSVYNSNN